MTVLLLDNFYQFFIIDIEIPFKQKQYQPLIHFSQENTNEDPHEQHHISQHEKRHLCA